MGGVREADNEQAPELNRTAVLLVIGSTSLHSEEGSRSARGNLDGAGRLAVEKASFLGLWLQRVLDLQDSSVFRAV